MTVLPALSLGLCALGIALVLFGQKVPLRRQIADRMSGIGGYRASERRTRWRIRNWMDRWDGMMFGSIKQEIGLVTGTIKLYHIIAFFITLAGINGVAIWIGGPISIGVVTIIGMVLGRGVVKMVAENHRKQFMAHFPAYLERITKLIEVGNSLSNAMKKALNYTQPKVVSYIGPALKRHNMGLDLSAALDMQARNLGIPEISQLAHVSYAVTRYGGNLKEILAHVAQVERDRIRARIELDALTAEVRASAKVFIALPLFVAGLIFAVHPAYVEFFIKDPLGPPIISGCAASIFLGLVIMRRMGNIE